MGPTSKPLSLFLKAIELRLHNSIIYVHVIIITCVQNDPKKVIHANIVVRHSYVLYILGNTIHSGTCLFQTLKNVDTRIIWIVSNHSRIEPGKSRYFELIPWVDGLYRFHCVCTNQLCIRAAATHNYCIQLSSLICL